MTRVHLRSFALAATSLVACATDDDGPASDDAAEGDSPRVTFYDDALPVLNEHCVGCHTDGGLAPFRLDDYAEAKEWSAAVVTAATERTMPPFGANNDGSCNTYQHARWLEDDELDVLAAWVDDGMVEGDAPATPLTPPELPLLSGAGIEEVYTPDYLPVGQSEAGGQYEDYQCFLIPLHTEKDRYIVGFEVEPGNDRIVHHVLGFKVDPTVLDNGKTMQALDDASPDQIGWDCYGAAGDNVFVESVPVTWAPGTGATEFPAGTGIPMGPNDVMVVQVHYNLVNETGSDSTTVRLKYADQVERPAVQALWDPFLYSAVFGSPEHIDAGLASATYDWSETISTITNLTGDEASGSGEVEIWGFLPHMHKRGRKMTIEIERDGVRSCATQVDRYDFNWQQAYFFNEPLQAKIGDKISVHCDWDTRGDTEPVMPGFSTADEMCLVGVYAVPK
jgi:mono/diheme cytochrome c family protein